jgi:uncharacterized membrane protein
MLIGFWIAGIVSDLYLLENGDHVWKNIWLIPSGIALVVTVIFIVFFKDNDFIKVNAERNSLKNSNVVEK